MNTTPYNLSTFGRAHTNYTTMRQLMQRTDVTVAQLQTHWAELQPQLSKLFGETPTDSTDTSFVNEHYTGMATAISLGLPKYAHSAWERMRVLQGLTIHLQLWIFFMCHFVATRPTEFTIDCANYHSRSLINEIANLLEDTDSIPNGLEGWAVDVINQCQEEADTEDAKGAAA